MSCIEWALILCWPLMWARKTMIILQIMAINYPAGGYYGKNGIIGKFFDLIKKK